MGKDTDMAPECQEEVGEVWWVCVRQAEWLQHLSVERAPAWEVDDSTSILGEVHAPMAWG